MKLRDDGDANLRRRCLRPVPIAILVISLLLPTLAIPRTVEALATDVGVQSCRSGDERHSFGRVSSSISNGTDITLVPGTVSVQGPVEQAVREAIGDAGEVLPAADYYSISAIRSAEDWLFVSAVALKGLDGNLKWNLQDAVWAGLVLLHREDSDRWVGATEGTNQFSILLSEVPDTVLDPRSKQDLDPLQLGLLEGSGYRFPWQSCYWMQYGEFGVHDAGFFAGWKAVDFLSDGNTNTGHAPNRLLAAASGSISYVCNDGTSVAVRIGDLLYAHLLNNGNLTTGHHFNQGDELGQLRPGSFSGNCGWASQGDNWFHVHWGFPDTGTFQAGGWTLNLSDQHWRRDSETQGIRNWFQAECGPSPTHLECLNNQCVRVSGDGSDQCSPEGSWCGTCPQSGGVILYWNNNYNCDNGEGDVGYRQTKSTGAWNISDAFNEKASSVRVPSGWSVMLYKDPGRGGSSACRTSDDDNFAGNTFLDLSDLNDAVSSFEVYDNGHCAKDPVNLFEHHHYTGSYVHADYEACFGMPTGFGASSVRLWPGWSVRVFKGSGCAGTSRCFTSNDSDFADNTFEDGTALNDQISSFRICHNTNCTMPTDAAEFVGQSQYPSVQPGEQFSIWFEVRNTGNTTWRDSDGYGLENQNGVTLGASAHQSIGADVAPGGTKRWNIQMTAPTTPGTYTTAWMLEHSGQAFGPNMFIDVTVQVTGPMVTVDDVRTTDENDGDKSSFDAGDSIKLKVTINNHGSSTITARVTWDVRDPSGNQYSALSWEGDLDLQPGVGTWSLSRSIPTDAATGTYSFAGRVDNNGEISSETTTFYVQGGIDAAEFVGQCQYPTVQPGQQFSIWFEMRNTGDTTWRDSDGYGLENQDGTTLGASPHQPIRSEAPPGSTKRWDIQMTAPVTEGTYRTAWMLEHSGQTFGPYMFIDVTVQPTGPTITADDVWTTDDNDQEKTSFDAGDPIKLKMTINNRGSSTITARVTWDVTDPSGNPYPDLSWDGDLDLQSGVWFWSLSKTIPSNAPTGTYSFTGRVDNNGEVSSSSTTFYVQGADVGPVVYDDYIVDDDNTGESSGNVDGVANCAETIELYVALRNLGPDAASGVVATISTNDPYTSWLYNTDSTYADIPGGGTGTNASDFDFYVDPGTPDGHMIHFDLDITASNGGPWSDSFDVPVVCCVQCNDPHEPNDTVDEATSLSYGTSLTDPEICPAGDVDLYSFIGSEGDIIVADIDASILGSYLDAYLYLLDTDGVTVLAQNDDYDGLDSRVVYTLPATGTYYLMVRHYWHPYEGGPDYFYTISLGGYTHRALMPLVTKGYTGPAGSEALSVETSASKTPAPTPMPVELATATATHTATPSPAPTITATLPVTDTATPTTTPSPTEVQEPEPEPTSTSTPTPAEVAVPTPTEAPTPSATWEEEPPP
jgi:hypothetical protein